jgi:hypothetical protein
MKYVWMDGRTNTAKLIRAYKFLRNTRERVLSNFSICISWNFMLWLLSLGEFINHVQFILSALNESFWELHKGKCNRMKTQNRLWSHAVASRSVWRLSVSHISGSVLILAWVMWDLVHKDAPIRLPESASSLRLAVSSLIPVTLILENLSGC